MAKFPVQNNDITGLTIAVNQMLAGPGGLGQNFAGFSAYVPAYLTGNYRVPFTQPTVSQLYVAPISLSTSEMLDGRTWKFTFSSAQSVPPFSLGSPVTVSGVTNDYYDGSYQPIGVIECTTTYCICKTNNTYAIVGPSTGGTIEFTVTNTVGNSPLNSTDANARVTVTGGTDKVFVTGQLDQLVSYTTTGSDNLYVTVLVNRYYGFLNPDPTNPDYLFEFDATVAQKQYTFNSLTGSGTLPLIETVFATILDTPSPDFYWYILEVLFETDNGLLQVTTDQLQLRDLSAQVVKQ